MVRCTMLLDKNSLIFDISPQSTVLVFFPQFPTGIQFGCNLLTARSIAYDSHHFILIKPFSATSCSGLGHYPPARHLSDQDRNDYLQDKGGQ